MFSGLQVFRCLALLVLWPIAYSPFRTSPAFAEDNERFWSLRPVRVVVPPQPADQVWSQSTLDPFVLAELEKHGLRPARAADRRTLLRRATFDLIGLPPTPAEVKAFLTDDSPDAFAKVVDRLLTTPQYGERWGRHWLDVVRYADARDLIQLPAESDFREAWRYRDWVVASLNRDLPYNQFVVQQVAGDLLQPADPGQIDADALVATGLLAIADFVPGNVDKQQMIADYVNDQIDVVGRAFLGLTLACARCHDHKFDPISIEDYYSLAGIFFSTRLVPGPVKGNTPLIRAPLLPPSRIAELEAGHVRDKSRLVELTRELSGLHNREYRSYIERQVSDQTQRYLLAAWDYVHPPDGQPRPSLEEFAKQRQIDALALSRWMTYFEETHSHAALAAVRSAPNQAAAEQRIRELTEKLTVQAAERRAAAARDATAKLLAESISFCMQADARRITTNDSHQVTLWPNRGRAPENAMPVAEIASPVLATLMVEGQQRAVLRFSGKELLQVTGTVPAAGTLFVVFRPDPSGAAGQRLVGWEDASVGQHGLGIMSDGAGALHVILRRSGASGDIKVPAPNPKSPAFQIVCVQWGPTGASVYRQGVQTGNNKAIESISSDPAITALRIGGPGSGESTRFQGDLAELRVYDQPLDDLARSRVEAELQRRWCAEESQTADPVADLYDELVSAQSPFRLSGPERDKALPDDFRHRLAAMCAELTTLQSKPPPDIPRAVVVQEGGPPGTPHEGFHDAHVYLRGDHTKLGKIVPRGFPPAIAGAQPLAIRTGSGRRELAQWLASPTNPLTARVMVNRIWQHHFGVGLVPSSGNFGLMGDRPSHPELLDYLAARFVESGWSVKAMHRLIMLSSVYQQDSASSAAGLTIDPENRLLWRANRRKLEAEALRDGLLAVAGRLDATPGGPAYEDVTTLRRSVYLMSVRTGGKTADFGTLFDAPDCSRIVERRTESIVAPQALFLMNDPLMSDLATGVANRIRAGSSSNRIGQLYELVLGRPATEKEVEIGLQLLGEHPQVNDWIGYCRLLLCTNEFVFVD